MKRGGRVAGAGALADDDGAVLDAAVDIPLAVSLTVDSGRKLALTSLGRGRITLLTSKLHLLRLVVRHLGAVV